jgi:WhiB family redox-sensing transcriptional regulator
MDTISATARSPGESASLPASDVPHDWRDLAACTEHDPGLFFPDDDEAAVAAAHLYAQSKRICAGCEVRGECLGFALDNRVNDGLWGGLTPSQRIRYRTEQNKSVTRTEQVIGRCRSGRHEKTPANTGHGGRCLECRREHDSEKYEAEPERQRDRNGRYRSGRARERAALEGAA